MKNPKNLDTLLIEIETGLARARDAKDDLEEEILSNGKRTRSYESPEEALASNLSEAEQLLEMALEIDELPDTRSRLIEKWARFETTGLSETRFLPQVDFLESKPLEYLQNVIRGVRLTRGEQNSSWESYELKKFEFVLRKTAVLLHRRGIEPEGELEVQKWGGFVRAHFSYRQGQNAFWGEALKAGKNNL